MNLRFKKLFKETNCIFIFIVIGILIMVYGCILHFTKSSDFLNKKIINIELFNKPCCSWWPVSHFILYFILGFLYPGYQFEFIIIGIGWELFEHLTSPISKLMRTNNENVKNIEYTSWISGSFNDIIFNIAGLYTGVILNRLFKN